MKEKYEQAFTRIEKSTRYWIDSRNVDEFLQDCYNDFQPGLLTKHKKIIRNLNKSPATRPAMSAIIKGLTPPPKSKEKQWIR